MTPYRFQQNTTPSSSGLRILPTPAIPGSTYNSAGKLDYVPNKKTSLNEFSKFKRFQVLSLSTMGNPLEMNAKRKCKTHKFQKLDKTLLNYRKEQRGTSQKSQRVKSQE